MCDHMDRHTPKGNVSLGASCPQRYLLKAMMFTHASPFTCCWVYVSGYIISLDRSLSRSLSPFPVSGTHTLFCPNVVSSLIHACIISSYFVASSNPLLFFSLLYSLLSFSPASFFFATITHFHHHGFHLHHHLSNQAEMAHFFHVDQIIIIISTT